MRMRTILQLLMLYTAHPCPSIVGHWRPPLAHLRTYYQHLRMQPQIEQPTDTKHYYHARIAPSAANDDGIANLA